MYTIENSADIRIMSWNILSEELTPEASPIETRIKEISEVITTVSPDAMGIQEVSEKCYGLLEEHLGDKYNLVNPKTKAGEFSFTGVMYDKTKYHLLANDIVVYPVGNIRIRIANWIMLKSIKKDYVFILLSTHWDVHSKNRPIQAEFMGNLVNELRKKHKCPIICTGDFNARESSAAFTAYLQISRQNDAKSICENVDGNCFTGHEVGSTKPSFEGTECIDHITVDDTMDVHFFKTIIDESSASLSDHFPIYSDLKFK